MIGEYFSIRDLGVTFSFFTLKNRDWEFAKCLETWKSGSLSMGGWLVSINPCLSSRPTYHLSMFIGMILYLNN